MGFFSELKKDLSNAVDEIDPEEKAAAEKKAEAYVDSWLDAYDEGHI